MTIRRFWDVEPHPSGHWQVKREKGQRATRVVDNKAEAVTIARALAHAALDRGQPGSVRLKGENGRIQQEWTYGGDPRRTRG
jgi:hypothetical protein